MRTPAGRQLLRDPAPGEHDVGVEWLRVGDRHQPLGGLEHHGGEVVKPSDRCPEPLPSDPASRRAKHALHRRRSVKLRLDARQ
jgi:hypothetical protein